MINIKDLHASKIKIDEKSYKSILIYYVAHVTFKDLIYLKINIVNPLYLVIGKTNGYFKKISGSKYLALIPTEEINEIMKNTKNCGIKSNI